MSKPVRGVLILVAFWTAIAVMWTWPIIAYVAVGLFFAALISFIILGVFYE